MSRPHRTLRVLLALGCAMSLIAGTSPVQAKIGSRNGEQERAIARCIRHASLGRGWLEKTLWGLRDQEAGWIGAEVLNTNGSHDLGPLQINSWWVPKIASMTGQPPRSVRYWLQYDPCFGAEAARWIFLSALAATGDYWTAIGIYHSPTGWRQRRYSSAVAVHMVRRFGPNVFADSR
jgi:hypothetical protein